MIEQDSTNEQSGTVSLLMHFGLTRQESAVYLALLSEGSMNGYEAAKCLGLSRSNAYTALAALVDKGAAWMVDGAPLRYTAVPASEFTDNVLHELGRSRVRLLASLPARRERSGGYVTIRGRGQILDRLRHLILETAERLYLALDSRYLEMYREEIAEIARAGKKLVIITSRAGIESRSLGNAFPCAELHGTEGEPAEIRAIADSRFVLTGDIPEGSGEPTCLFSDERNLVELFKSALRNEIRLAALEEGAGK
jgi:sugar-specific transcriptional regulator TrmB